MKIKKVLGLFLIRSWTEAVRLPLHQIFSLSKNCLFAGVVLGTPVCVRERVGVTKHSESQLSGSVTDGR